MIIDPHLCRQGEESSRPGNESAFFATTADDGRVLFWDMRVWRLKKTKRCCCHLKQCTMLNGCVQRCKFKPDATSSL